MTPIEIVAIVFVVGSFVAIGARFTPRDAFGARRAPRPIDDSIGMYALRRLRRRSTLTEADLVQPSLEEILQRIGVAPAAAIAETEHEPSDRADADTDATLAASTALPTADTQIRQRPEQVGPVPPGDLLAAMRAAVDRPPRTITQRMPQAALTAQRRVGGLVAVALIVAAGLGGASLASLPGGGVLDAVGTPAPAAPAASPGGSDAPAPTPGASAGPDDAGG